MLPFERLKKDVKKLKQGGFNKVLQEAIIANSKTVLDLNRQNQLYTEGIDIKDRSLPEYTSFTKMIKQSKGQPYDRTTLKDTGDFYKHFFLKIDNQGFEIDSSDVKRDELVRKYTEDIFGLNDDSKRILQNILKIALIQRIRKLI